MGLDKDLMNAIGEHREKIKGPHFIFSAENPAHPHKNLYKLSHEEAVKHLKENGFDAHGVEGHYGSPERSIIVYGTKPEHHDWLHQFAANLGQDSSIHSEGEGKAHEMRFHHGLKAGTRAKGKGTTWHQSKPKDFFTSLPGNTHHFTHNIEAPMEESEEYQNPHRSSMKAGDGDLEKAESNDKVRGVADSYASSKGLKLDHNIPSHKINEAHATKISNAYHNMKHDPNHPEVKQAYGALVGEVQDQFHHVMNNGKLKISRIKPGQDNPYKSSKDLHEDIKNNNHMWYFPTEQGFGSKEGQASDHPMLSRTGVKHDGHELLANDMFRIVHDYFGHAKEGHSFGARGEDNAWKHHMQMFSPSAQRALTTETRGQNSWVNFGPHGEHNRKNPAQTIYADQKAGLLPSWAQEEKSEDLDKSDYGPKGMSLYSQVDNARRKEGRTGETAEIGPNKAVRATRGTLSEQAERDAKEARAKSRRSPVKKFNQNQIKYLNRKASAHGGDLSVPIKSKLAASEIYKAEEVGNLDTYKHNAHNNCDVLFRATIKGKTTLEDDIPFHMSIKIFKTLEEADVSKLKKQVKELKLTERPNPKKLTFKETIFTGRDGNKYFMVMIDGLDPKFQKFYEMNKDRGTVYDNGFMPHLTINKELYEDIKKNGLKAEDVQFGPLILEQGAGNIAHEFEEELEKGAIRNALVALGTAGAMAATPAGAIKEGNSHKQAPPSIQQKSPAQHDSYSSKRMLATIADVESKGGKYTEHAPLGGIHHGESAFGKYGITPVIIRETVRLHPELKGKHKKVMNLQGDDVRRYMEDNPGLEDEIAQKHLQRLEHHFGHNPSALGYAWLEGIRGGYKAQKENKDINSHWHVKKINNAYSRIK